MTNKQKIELRLSEVRQRLNEISGLEGDAFTDEIRGEADTLQSEYRDLEVRHRAAITSESEEEARMQGAFNEGDGESAEIRQLMGAVSIADYLTPASAGRGVEGRAKELNAALKVEAVGKGGGVAIPWAVIAGPTPAQPEGRQVEQRAFTTTTNYAGGIAARPILQRLFGPGILDALGVRLDSVPSGRAEWPLLTGGVAPDMKAEGTAADAAVAASFTTETLKPKRLTGKYEFTHEQVAQVPGIEEALRRDLADAVRSKMSDLALNGDESTNAQEPDGFLTKLSAPSAPGAVATYEDFAGSHASAVDGIHAQTEMQVSSVIGVASYQLAAKTYRSGAGSDESASEALKRRSAGCVASSYIPAAPAAGAKKDVQDGNIFHGAGPNGGGAAMRGDSIAAVWPTLEVIRDPYTQASQGVVLTWVSLWDLEAAFRSAAYKRIAFKVA
ncbi:MAG: phage major capsid protein [Nitrospinae bacterium]|nr:phage major capsid protein [Nitrospinota bacterium]